MPAAEKLTGPTPAAIRAEERDRARAIDDDERRTVTLTATMAPVRRRDKSGTTQDAVRRAALEACRTAIDGFDPQITNSMQVFASQGRMFAGTVSLISDEWPSLLSFWWVRTRSDAADSRREVKAYVQTWLRSQLRIVPLDERMRWSICHIHEVTFPVDEVMRNNPGEIVVSWPAGRVTASVSVCQSVSPSDCTASARARVTRLPKRACDRRMPAASPQFPQYRQREASPSDCTRRRRARQPAPFVRYQ